MTTCLLMGQTVDYERKYDLLVSKLGPAGVGVETVLDSWYKADSTNVKLLKARFDLYFNKAIRNEVVKKDVNPYLGMKPVLSLKDSTGAEVYYYQIQVFEDELYGKALKEVDKAITLYPEKLDLRLMKANAYIAYEQENPDMALAYLLSLIHENALGKISWEYEDKKVAPDFFNNAILEYCYAFYSLGTKENLEAFLVLSEKMNSYYPDETQYINNIGTYYMVAMEDYKKALKYYGKTLKKNSSDYTAIKNSLIAAKKLNNVKLEKKYLNMLVEHGPELEKQQAQARLNAIGK